MEQKAIIPPVDTTTTTSFFAKGADVSWLTQMEASGYKNFMDSKRTDRLFANFKRPRHEFNKASSVWVNPADNYNNTADVVAKAIRAKNAGMKIMIDFHYSDTWADPGHQTKPAAWATQDFATLKMLCLYHTTHVMDTLKSNGITPEWVQVGNETNDGMLWPEGKASTNMANFALLVNAGYDAVKSVSDSSKVIVHISNGYDNSLFRWMFDGLKNNGAKWDIIGMSLYPTASNWSTLNAQCLANMNDMVARYNKEVMVVRSWNELDRFSCLQFFSYRYY